MTNSVRTLPKGVKEELARSLLTDMTEAASLALKTMFPELTNIARESAVLGGSLLCQFFGPRKEKTLLPDIGTEVHKLARISELARLYAPIGISSREVLSAYVGYPHYLTFTVDSLAKNISVVAEYLTSGKLPCPPQQAARTELDALRTILSYQSYRKIAGKSRYEIAARTILFHLKGSVTTKILDMTNEEIRRELDSVAGSMTSAQWGRLHRIAGEISLCKPAHLKGSKECAQTPRKKAKRQAHGAPSR